MAHLMRTLGYFLVGSLLVASAACSKKEAATDAPVEAAKAATAEAAAPAEVKKEAAPEAAAVGDAAKAVAAEAAPEGEAAAAAPAKVDAKAVAGTQIKIDPAKLKAAIEAAKAKTQPAAAEEKAK